MRRSPLTIGIHRQRRRQCTGGRIPGIFSKLYARLTAGISTIFLGMEKGAVTQKSDGGYKALVCTGGEPRTHQRMGHIMTNTH